jgi:hypothetical protein
MAKLWSQLSPRTQAKYRNQGISPATYNAWYRKSSTQRSILGAKARREGYESGLDQARAESAPVTRARAGRVIADAKIRRGGNPRYWNTSDASAVRAVTDVSTERTLSRGTTRVISALLLEANGRGWSNSQLYHEMRDAGVDHATAAAIAYT